MSGISPSDLPRLLRYEPETGLLFWRPRTVEMFEGRSTRRPSHAAANWNALYAESEAFTYTGPDGYRQGAIWGVPLKAHRVVWALLHGHWPPALIDHINGCRADNRAVNLRCVDKSGNARNTAKGTNNTSGHVGVFWSAQVGKWQARFSMDGKNKHVGFFTDIEAAAAAIRHARLTAGFSDRHGM